MARVLAISSHVAYGSVGLASIVPALHWLGHEVMPLPTVVLSCNPAYPHFAGDAVPAERIVAIAEALTANGWLAGTDAVVTGYLPTRDHVSAARAAVAMVRSANPAARYLCDPVFGDEPGGLYLPEAVATAIATDLMPLADLATPNSFELAWLAKTPVGSPTEARDAARKLAAPTLLATSVPDGDNRLANVLVTGDDALACSVKLREDAPHGTGDMLCAMFLGQLLNGRAPADCLASAASAVDASVTAAHRLEELPLAGAAALWASARTLPVSSV